MHEEVIYCMWIPKLNYKISNKKKKKFRKKRVGRVSGNSDFFRP